MSLLERIYDKIEEDGGISIADYMYMALSDPQEGYYMHQTPLGLKGDFITSPEISQVFGEMLGIWMAECWHMLGKPKVDVVEVGPGLGTLMDDFLRATKTVKGFHEAMDVHMVETSPQLQSHQRTVLRKKHPRIQWHYELPESDRPLLILGNEFFDALPIEQYVITKTGFRERRIVCEKHEDEKKLAYKPSDKEKRYLPTPYPPIGAGDLPEETVVEICPMAQVIMRQVATRIAKCGGAGLFIDYGYVRPEGMTMYAGGDTFQAVKKHKYHNELEAPGTADLTAHVDFSSLADVAVAAGGYTPPVLTQGEFLTRMGGEVRMQQLCRNANSKEVCENLARGYQRLTDTEDMGELFKVLAVMPAGIPAPVFDGKPQTPTPPPKSPPAKEDL